MCSYPRIRTYGQVNGHVNLRSGKHRFTKKTTKGHSSFLLWGDGRITEFLDVLRTIFRERETDRRAAAVRGGILSSWTGKSSRRHWRKRRIVFEFIYRGVAHHNVDLFLCFSRGSSRTKYEIPDRGLVLPITYCMLLISLACIDCLAFLACRKVRAQLVECGLESHHVLRRFSRLGTRGIPMESVGHQVISTIYLHGVPKYVCFWGRPVNEAR